MTDTCSASRPGERPDSPRPTCVSSATAAFTRAGDAAGEHSGRCAFGVLGHPAVALRSWRTLSLAIMSCLHAARTMNVTTMRALCRSGRRRPGSYSIAVGLRSIRSTGYGPAAHVTKANAPARRSHATKGEIKPNASPRIRVCQDLRVRRHDRGHTRLHRSPARAPSSRSLMKPAGCHDQHKPTHNLRRPTNARDSPYEQNPQVKGISLGSRDRTRTYNLPVNSRTLCQLSYAGLAGAGANGLERAAVPADCGRRG